jgi:manganese/zinc/iron transport system ATP- binding protein
MDSRKAFEVENLFVNYGKAAVLWDVTFSIPAGVLVGVVGPNGAGKSTLLKSSLNLVRPLSGKIDFFGEPIESVRSKIAYVPQRESVDWDFPITALEVVLMGRYGRLSLFKRLKKADRVAAKKALDLVGMSFYAHHQIGELSGGQQQRLFIARAIVQNPDLYLLDEPFAGIDMTTEKEIVSILKNLRDQGKTILVVHHDLQATKEYFDWALLLNTRLVACGPVAEVFNNENLCKTYGRSVPLFEEAANLSARQLSGL